MTTFLKSSLVAAVLALSTACSQNSDVASANTIGPESREFVQSAIKAGYTEIMMGQLALRKGSDTELKEFAQDLIDDHGEINENLTKMAREHALDIPDFHDDGTAKDNTAAELETLQGGAFDAKYAAFLVDAHVKSVQTYENFIRVAQKNDFKDFAEDHLDTIKEHLEKAQEFNRSLPQKSE